MIKFKITKPSSRKKNYTLTIDNSKSNVPLEYANRVVVSVIGDGITRNGAKILSTKKSPEPYLAEIRKKIYSPMNKIEGGLGDNRTIENLAKKYKVKPIHYKKIYAAIDAGIGVEKEHTNDIERMKEIAFDHLWETGMLYYQELSKMEKKLERNPVKFEKGAEVGDDNDRMRMLALKAKADADALALLELEMEMGSGETKVESKEESKLQKFINDVTFDQLFKNEVEIPSEFFDAYEEFVATGKFTYNDDVADYFIQKFNLENNPEKVKTVVYWVSQNIKKREAKAYFDKMISEGWNVLSNDELEKLSKSKAKITIDKDIKGIKYFNVVEGSDGNYVLVHSKSKKSGYSPYSSNPLYPTLYKLYSESTETKPVEIEPETAPQKEAWEMTKSEIKANYKNKRAKIKWDEFQHNALENILILHKRKNEITKENSRMSETLWNQIINAGIIYKDAGKWNLSEDVIEYDKAANMMIDHEYFIKQAISEGKPVPAEVLADYPELQKSEPNKEPEEKLEAGGFIKCPTGTRVQSVLMSKDIFSRKEAVKWVKEHDYSSEIDETENYYRFRQQEPEQFEEESFRTIEFTDGIKAVIGCPLNKKMERGDSVKYDRAGNPIGEGSWHIEPEVFEFSEYPQIKSSVDYSQSTESTYVTYRNTENDKKITVRFSQHENNAVKFGDQLNGYFATKDEVLYHLGLKKREFIPKTFLSIPNMQVAKKKLGNYEEADKTIQEMYALGANADISMYNGKIAKGSNYLIMGDTVEEIIDTRQGSFGNPVELGKYVYSDIDENNKKAESGMKINDGTILYRVTKNENLTKENIRLPFHAGTLEQAERIADIKDYGNDAVYYKIILDENARIYTTSDTVANILDKEIRKEITVSIGKNILNDCISVVMRNVKTNEIIPFINTNGEATPFVNLQDKDASDFLYLHENSDYDAIRYENEIEGDGYSYLILTDKFKIEKMSGTKAEKGMKIDTDTNGGAAYEGNLHTEGGIPATVKETGQEIEFEVGEIVINRVDAQKHCEELSKINSEHGKKIDCDCLRNSNKDENLKDPKMEGEIDETGMVKLEKGAEIDKNMEKTLSNESNIIQDAIENQELEIEEMETATMFENGDKIGGKQRHYKFRDDSFFVVDWVEQDGKQVAVLVDKQPRNKWFSIGESSADQILEDAEKAGIPFDEMLKTLIQNGAFVNIHAKGAAISGEYPHPFVKAIDEQIIKAGKEYRAIEDAIYGLAGDRNKQKRQEVISAIVGDKVPAAKSGISAIEEELKKWILAKYPNANVTKRFEPILKEEAKADTTEKEAWEMTLDEYVEEKSKDIPEGSISDLRAEFHNEYYNAIQKHLESNGQISQRVYEQLEPIFQNRVVAKYRTPISGTEPKTETIPENIPIEVAKSKEYQEAYRKYEMGLISLDELKSFGKEQPQTAPETEHMEKVKTKTADIEWENILLSMIPNAQKKMMSVSEDFEVNKERLITQLKAMPKLYGQDGKKGDTVAYFHYFVGSLDIYLTEFSKSDDESSPYEFYTFGSAVEGGDFEGAYAYFPDWLNYAPKNIELDYYFEPTPLRNIVDERNPYYEKEQEAPTADNSMANIRTKIYSNAYEQNKGIEKFIELAGENTVFTGEDIEFMNRYTGYGGLGKFMDVETVQRTEAVGTLYEYYTPDELCKKLWGLAYKHGFDASQLVLEPSCGIGRIIKYAPNKSLVKAYETNPTSSFIAKATYRDSDIVNDYFESEFYMGFGKRTRNKDYAPAYGLVIGNYPFGDYSGKYASMGEKDYSKATQVDHHFIVRGLDALVSGGLMVCIVNSRFMQGGHDAVKAEIEKRGELIDAYRLPAGVFQNTEVIADILVIRKK